MEDQLDSPSVRTAVPRPINMRTPNFPVSPAAFEELPTRSYTVSCQFRLGWSTVHASGTPYWAIVDDNPHWGIERRIWHHVLRLQVRHGWLATVIRAGTSLLPARMASHLKALLPGPFLPTCIIVKQKKVDWEDEFDNEIRRYEQLKALQGTIIPDFFGTTTLDGTVALVLSDVGGEPLLRVSYSDYTRDELERKLYNAMYPVYRLGVSLDDANLLNCHLVDGRVWLVDHEQDEDVEDHEWDQLEDIVEGKANSIMRKHWEIHGKKDLAPDISRV